MAKVEVIALKTHSPDGMKRYKVGAKYSISAQSAKTLAAMGFVRISPSEEPKVTPDEPAPKEPRRYNRRDMRAQD